MTGAATDRVLRTVGDVMRDSRGIVQTVGLIFGHGNLVEFLEKMARLCEIRFVSWLDMDDRRLSVTSVAIGRNK